MFRNVDTETILAIDCGPLAPAPLGAHVTGHAVRRGLTRPAPLHPKIICILFSDGEKKISVFFIKLPFSILEVTTAI